MTDYNKWQVTEIVLNAQRARASIERIIAPYCPGQHCAEHRPTSFTCPVCGMTSHNPSDIQQGYCGNCHQWTGKGYA